jgi:hypothetical protein
MCPRHPGEYFRLEYGDPIKPWRRCGRLPFTSSSRDGAGCTRCRLVEKGKEGCPGKELSELLEVELWPLGERRRGRERRAERVEIGEAEAAGAAAGLLQSIRTVSILIPEAPEARDRD